jgi:hypothetical protein
MTSFGATPVRRSVAWLLLALLGIACGSQSLQTDGGRDGRAGADGPGAGAGHGGTAGSTAGAGPEAGGASGSPGTGDGSSEASDGATAGADAKDAATAGTDANDGGATASDGAAVEADTTDGAATASMDAGDGGGLLCGGMTLYGLTVGNTCFDIVSVAPGSNDGCMLGVADATGSGIVGMALPFSYDQSTATASVGTNGGLGVGQVICNMGTLTRETSPTLAAMPACSWHQTDTSVLHMTATNEFDLSVTEAENMFRGCSAANTPTGGQCTSTWTWHMKKSTKFFGPLCR